MNEIKDTDALAFIDQLYEELDVEYISISRTSSWGKSSFTAYPKGDSLLRHAIHTYSINELKQKLSENTLEARKLKELEEARAKVAELEKELGGTDDK